MRSVLPVPPGSTALREFCHIVVRALTMPVPAIRPGMSSVQSADEVAYLRLCQSRAQLVLVAMRRILADREVDDHDVMVFVTSIREQIADYSVNGYYHAGQPS
jgi:hypothetical protein